MFALLTLCTLIGFAFSIVAHMATTEASTFTQNQDVDQVLTAANDGGDVVQLQSGLAGVRQGLVPGAIGDLLVYSTDGSWRVQKKTTVEFLDGQWIWWDNTLKQATHQADTAADFPLGVALGDQTAAATVVIVLLNERPYYDILHQASEWSEENVDGLGVVTVAGVAKLEFDAVAEIAQAALLDDIGVPIGGNGIFEAEIRIADGGDNVALDINFGVADQSDAADADLIPESAFFHIDGADLSIFTESDDGVTDVAAVDSGVNFVAAQYHFVQIDMRDIADVKFLFDGVRLNSGTTHILTAAVGPMKLLVHMEKTSDNTTADLRIRAGGIRTAKQAA